MTRDAFIYALADATGVRYVGRSINPRARLSAHSTHNDEARTHTLDGSPLRLLILEATTEEDQKERERFWIAALGGKHPLVNVVNNPHVRWTRAGRAGGYRWTYVPR